MVSNINSTLSNDSTSILQMWQNLFSKIDKNGDNSINQSEFSVNAPKKNKDSADIFKTLDANGDNVISKTEFVDGMKALDQQMQALHNAMQMGLMPPPPPPSSVQDGEKVFNAIDQNADGTIDQTDLQTALKGTGIDTAKLFDILDTNGDDVITKSEFTDNLKKFDEQMQAQNPAGTSAADNVQGDGEQTGSSGANTISSAGKAEAPGGGTKPSGTGGGKVYDDRDTNKDGIVSQSEIEAAEGITTDTTDQISSASSNEEIGKSKIIDTLFQAYLGAYSDQQSSMSLFA
jgi:Ca2+-binding EF-hand superfamily protein